MGLAAAVLTHTPAAAQSWTPYDYAEAGFTAQFPAQPTASKGAYTTAEGLTAPTVTYAVEQDGVRYAVMVADFSKTDLKRQAAIDDAVKALARSGTVQVDVAARIDREFGRELTVLGPDGARITAAVFFVNGRLYELTGRTTPAAAQTGSARAARFEESLEFDGEAAGRPENRLGGRPPGGGPGGADDGGRRRRTPPQQAFDDCIGKAEGDAVQHTTPRGSVVAATCVATPRGLAARPIRPPDGPGPPPPVQE
jgi:hypothetical protein